MKKQAAVIGANGYVGNYLCKALENSGSEVIKLTAGERFGISLETGLFPEDLSFPAGLETVYFLAQSPRYRQTPDQSAHLISVNCVAAVQSAEAARCAGVKKFIYASTGNVYQPSFLPIAETAPVRRDNWYSLSKVMAENALSLYRPYFDLTMARIFGVYGPEQTDKLVPMIANRIETGQDVLIDKNSTNSDDLDGLVVSLIYIDDLVRALVLLGDINHCEHINLAGIEAISIRRLATELAGCMGLPVRIKMNDSNRAFNLIANTALQVELLGNPSISLSEGLQRFCNERNLRI